ncbi:MAG: hypothetical protein ACI97A_002462 [Planctomycetota bacterium]|jgi:hypothetical protein
MNKSTLMSVLIIAILVVVVSEFAKKDVTVPPTPDLEEWPSIDLPTEPGLFVIGNDLGMLRPCGCAKPVLGGISRRGAFFSTVDPQVMLKSHIVSVGNLIKEGGRQQELKLEAFLDSMSQMTLGAFCPGDLDLLVGAAFWQELLESRSATDFPIVSANLYYNKKRLFSSHALLKIGDEQIIVTGFVSPSSNALSEPQLEVQAKPDVSEIIAALAAGDSGKSRHLFVAGTGSLSELESMIEILGLKSAAKSVLIALAGVSDLPVMDVKKDKLLGMESGQKGRDVGYTTWPKGSSLEHYTLTGRFGQDAEQDQVLEFYRGNVKFEQLLVEVPRFDEAEGEYAGSESCGDCHPGAHSVWSKTRHAHAFDSLVRTNDQWDPECVQCHVVDFDRLGGFDPVAIEPINVQCEACHGPSMDHVSQQTPTPRGKLGETFCFKCHDLANSPKFDFKTYWPKIAHTK